MQGAIAKGREFLINLQNPDGSFTPEARWRGCYSTLITMTLAYLGEHPNRPTMSKALDYVVSLAPNRDFHQRDGYAIPIRVMCLAYVHGKVGADKQAQVRRLMQEDLARIIGGQNAMGGWRYRLDRSDDDTSASQWPILAMYEANRVGVEFPLSALPKAMNYFFRGQQTDGGWGYLQKGNSYGSMTAAGLASLFIVSDLASPASGCPCRGGQSQKKTVEVDRRIDAALEWLATRFDPARNPGWKHQTNFDELYYWLYSAERVGIAAGYKYFGTHNWYKEGAEALVARQQADGSWEQIDPKVRTPVDNWGGGRIADTCFALLFLHKGRAPVLFNKLRFDGVWNAHRRDLANLTWYIEKAKEQRFHWQIVELAAPIEELHDAPILYITAESLPKWTNAEKLKLRAFTDTGGTILFEASCGSPTVRKWFEGFAKQVWPEWTLEALAEDHPVFTDLYPLGKKRPEVLGLDDGLRTFLFFSPDDISCPWHMKAFLGKEHLFQWGINLFTYATDKAPLRAKLAGPPPASKRYAGEVEAGARKTLEIARLKHSGNWEAGANYGSFRTLAERVKKKAGVALKVVESNILPVTKTGASAADLASADVAYLAGSKPFALTEAEGEGLKAFVARGGFVWAEYAGGVGRVAEAADSQAPSFDTSVQQMAKDLGLETRPLESEHPIVSGKAAGAAGYDLAKEVSFRRGVRIRRPGMKSAQMIGLFAGERLAGVYSPYDVMFSLNGYEAYNCMGYEAADAEAVATNLVLYLSTIGPDGKPLPAAPKGKDAGAKVPGAKDAGEKVPGAKDAGEKGAGPKVEESAPRFEWN